MAGERGGLCGDALHHAAVATQRVDVEVNQILEAGFVEVGRHPASGDGHADAVRQTLTQRAGRRLDAAGPAVLGMARTAAIQLAEMLDRLQRHRRFAQRFVLLADRLDAGQMQQRVQQH